MGSFFKGAPGEQVHNMLRKLGTYLPQRLDERGDPSLPLWVSTAGYDIAWLHVRLDDQPKYYRFKSYKEWNETKNTWSKDNSYSIGQDISKCTYDVMVMDQQAYPSLANAVEALNAGTLQCPRGICIVRSEQQKLYFLLARSDKLPECIDIAKKTFGVANPGGK